ncbi:hypothetical protein EB796_025152 [Bugula neritina]|uniref:Uncharacterized protein n=1 Tax=Bugula neritina TaxID=10212 RepID=A0A7J7IRM1_BUGNE|nr:hypothetical protein EB796_025152 [Bugula neritina]
MMRNLKQSVIMVVYLTVVTNSTELSCDRSLHEYTNRICAPVHTASFSFNYKWEMMENLKQSVIMVIYLTVVTNSTELSCGM